MMNEALLVAATVSRSQGALSNAEDLDLIHEGLFQVDHSQVKQMTVAMDKIESDEE